MKEIIGHREYKAACLKALLERNLITEDEYERLIGIYNLSKKMQ